MPIKKMNNKSSYNPNIHHRRSIRLKGYDYSQQGLYFVTLCVKNRHCLFGEIIDQEMILNDAGIMVNKWYNELENKFSDIKCHEHVVMPNHFHCIIENTGTNVGADLRVCPDNKLSPDNLLSPDKKGGHAGPPQPSPPDDPILGEHKGSPLWQIIQWFKTMSTNEYIRNVNEHNWPCFDGKLWQRNYWEHIIRDEKAYHTIAEYIINNPQKWDNDSINPKFKK
jgi:REP element-mobilizing transposase RayT